VYSIQHYVIKFVSDLRQVCGFHRHNITEILLKVALNTITMTKPSILTWVCFPRIVLYLPKPGENNINTLVIYIYTNNSFKNNCKSQNEREVHISLHRSPSSTSQLFMVARYFSKILKKVWKPSRIYTKFQLNGWK
jgi:hypothetical protein